jgi:hypothetical protein
VRGELYTAGEGVGGQKDGHSKYCGVAFQIQAAETLAGREYNWFGKEKQKQPNSY